jgi:hypothetical protein
MNIPRKLQRDVYDFDLQEVTCSSEQELWMLAKNCVDNKRFLAAKGRIERISTRIVFYAARLSHFLMGS